MVVVKNILSLEMLKMEKNFIAVIDKGYKRKPYEEFNIKQLYYFTEREFLEYENAYELLDYNDELTMIRLMNEIADVSNTLDYLYERLLRLIKKC